MYVYVDLDSSFMLKFTSIKSGKSLLPYFRAELLWFVSHTMVCKRVDLLSSEHHLVGTSIIHFGNYCQGPMVMIIIIITSLHIVVLQVK